MRDRVQPTPGARHRGGDTAPGGGGDPRVAGDAPGEVGVAAARFGARAVDGLPREGLGARDFICVGDFEADEDDDGGWVDALRARAGEGGVMSLAMCYFA